MAFRSLRVAAFLDGWFRNGCPKHATWPRQNAEFWRAKTLTNQAPDRDTDARLRTEGREVVRVWAHEAPHQAAPRIAMLVRRRRKMAHA